MPLTLFAHQVPVLPLKAARPRWFDGTALCLGSMTPDFAYPIPGWVNANGHNAFGALVWSVPVTMALCLVVRSVAPSGFAHLPDLPRLGIHTRRLRVLAARRPPWWQTAWCGLAGALTHIVLDSFTHRRRWGARLLGFDSDALALPLLGTRSVANVLQLTWHSVGSLVGLLLLARLLGRRHLVAWYGADAVAVADAPVALDLRRRLGFWAVVGAGLVGGLAWSRLDAARTVFSLIDAGLLFGLLASALPWLAPDEVLVSAVPAD